MLFEMRYELGMVVAVVVVGNSSGLMVVVGSLNRTFPALTDSIEFPLGVRIKYCVTAKFTIVE